MAGAKASEKQIKLVKTLRGIAIERIKKKSLKRSQVENLLGKNKKREMTAKSAGFHISELTKILGIDLSSYFKEKEELDKIRRRKILGNRNRFKAQKKKPMIEKPFKPKTILRKRA